MAIKLIKKLLKDPRHWIGWFLTTGVIIGVFHLLNVHLHTPLYQIPILLGVIVIVDLFKHVTEIQ